MFDLAAAVHERRSELADVVPYLVRLREAVGNPGGLSLGQWLQLYATTLSYEPSIVIELGRGLGNSTTVFTVAATRLPATKVVSVGLDLAQGWRTRTVPKLKPLVDE